VQGFKTNDRVYDLSEGKSLGQLKVDLFLFLFRHPFFLLRKERTSWGSRKKNLRDCFANPSLFSFSPDIFLFSKREKKKAVRKRVIIPKTHYISGALL